MNLRTTLMLFLLAAPCAAAGETPHGIRVTGEGRVEVVADVALLDFAVVTQDASAGIAARENAARMQAVMSAIKSAAGAGVRLHTGTYGVRPLYASTRESGAPRITGYEVRNAVHARTQSLDTIGLIIDAAVGAGANQIQRVAFTVSDDSSARRTALGAAAADALARAGEVTRALQLKAGSITSVVEQDVGVVQPLARYATAMNAESAPATPIEPGRVQVRARVTLTVEIAR